MLTNNFQKAIRPVIPFGEPTKRLYPPPPRSSEQILLLTGTESLFPQAALRLTCLN